VKTTTIKLSFKTKKQTRLATRNTLISGQRLH